MDYSPVFLRARTIAFSLISLISFIWIVILCVDLFLQWEAIDRSEKSFLAVMLLTDTLTLIMLIVLLLLPFRPWLDGARFLLLLVAHIGIASAFVVWNPQFQCPGNIPDQQGICKLLNMCILIANWIIPAFLIVYAAGLSLMVYGRSRQLKTIVYDAKTTSRNSHHSILPMMEADIRRPSVSNTSSDDTTSGRWSGQVLGATSVPHTRHQSTLPIEPYYDNSRRPCTLPGPVATRVSRQHLGYAPNSLHQSILTVKSLDGASRRPSTLSGVPERDNMRMSGQHLPAGYAASRHQSIFPANSRPSTFSAPYRVTPMASSGQQLSGKRIPRTLTDASTMIMDVDDASKNQIGSPNSEGRSRLSKPLPSWML